MRAVFSVIKAAGVLKGKHKEELEDKLVLKALRDVNVPKFLTNDLLLFDNIIMDLFPGVEKPEDNYGLLVDSLNISITERGYINHDYFVKKVYQLYDTINVRHGLMLVGPAGGGKTQNYKCL
jgi:dynein heavy chain